jgi:hypothetical protein
MKFRIRLWTVILILISQHLLSASISPQAAASPPLKYMDGLVSISSGSFSRSELLEMISEAAGFEVVLIGLRASEEKIIVNYDRQKPEGIVRSLLVGRSYAIIYSGRGSSKSMGQQTRFHSEQAEIKSAADETPGTSVPEEETESASPRERRLKSQIAALKNRVESGRSDQAYEIWTSVRDPRYVVHEEDLLIQHEKELAELKTTQ